MDAGRANRLRGLAESWEGTLAKSGENGRESLIFLVSFLGGNKKPTISLLIELGERGGGQAAICAQLDEALLTDEEMLRYDERYAEMVDPDHPGLSSPVIESAAKKVKVAE